MQKLQYLEEYQQKQHQDWIRYLNDPADKYGIGILPIDLLKTSKPVESDIFQLDSLNNIQYPYTKISIKTAYDTSYFYIPSFYTGWNEFWFLLESLCYERETYIHLAEGEGADSIFYIETLANNKIRFVHFNESLDGFKYNENLDKYERCQIYPSTQEYYGDEPWQIRQDIIMYKHLFVKSFYKELLLFFKSKDEPFSEFEDEYMSLTKDSEVIREYLNKYNIRYEE